MRTVAIAIFILSLAMPARAQQADDILGFWNTGENKGRVEIFKRSGKYYGKLVWLKDPLNEAGKPKVDKNNPEESLRQQPIVGLEILKGFEFDDDEWEDGTIYDPENGKTYSCVMTLKGDQLNVRGYVGISWIGRTTVWTRANP
ncbi:MAG: DUF2147 domain-containing protein [Bacteroidota bacterium]